MSAGMLDLKGILDLTEIGIQNAKSFKNDRTLRKLNVKYGQRRAVSTRQCSALCKTILIHLVAWKDGWVLVVHLLRHLLA